MAFEVSWSAKFLATNFTWMIFNSFMDLFYMSCEIWLDKFLVTNATFNFFWCPSHFFFRNMGNSLQIQITINSCLAISSCTTPVRDCTQRNEMLSFTQIEITITDTPSRVAETCFQIPWAELGKGGTGSGKTREPTGPGKSLNRFFLSKRSQQKIPAEPNINPRSISSVSAVIWSASWVQLIVESKYS